MLYISAIQVAETKNLVSILEGYLEQRGVALPEGYLSYKVICPDPNFWYVFLLCSLEYVQIIYFPWIFSFMTHSLGDLYWFRCVATLVCY